MGQIKKSVKIHSFRSLLIFFLPAVIVTTGSFTRTTLCGGLPFTAVSFILLLVQGIRLSRVAALLSALNVVKAAVALLACFDNFVATEGTVGFGEAVGLPERTTNGPVIYSNAELTSVILRDYHLNIIH